MSAATARTCDMQGRMVLLALMLAGPVMGQPAQVAPAVPAGPTRGQVLPPDVPDVEPVDPDDPAAGEQLTVQLLSPTNRYRWPEPPPMGWATAIDPAGLPVQRPETGAAGTVSFTAHLPVLDDELEPTEQAVVAALLADFTLAELTALNQFFLGQPEGDRGAFVRLILEERPAALAPMLRVLALLDADERNDVARGIFVRETRQWLAIADLSVAVAPETAAEMLLFRNFPAICHQVTPALQPSCRAAQAAFFQLYGSASKGPGMLVAKRGIAPFMAQLYRVGADAAAQGTPRVKAAERRTLGQLRNEWDRLHVCGAAYMGAGWVLTAAHCIPADWDKYNAFFFAQRRVRLGTLDIHQRGETWGIDAVVRHGAYTSVKDGNDIALIRLRGPPRGQQDEAIAAAVLPARPQKYGTTLQITGWGVTGVTRSGGAQLDIRYQFQEASRLLRVGWVKLLPNDVCNSNAHFRARTYRVGTGQICAGSDDGADSCRGDSGGPLVLAQAGKPAILVGLVSYGPGCGQQDTPGVYTDVRHFAGWVAAAKAQARPGMIIDFVPGRCRHAGVEIACAAPAATVVRQSLRRQD